MTSSRRHRWRGAAACGLAALLVLTGCTAGPDPGPQVVRGDDGGGETGGSPTLPELSAPKNDLNYGSCGDELESYDAPTPKGLELACADFDSPIDPASPNGSTITVGVVRATLPDTPDDAAPLVLTTGDDLPSSRLLLSLNVDAVRELLVRHPIVAVDRRGIGLSSPIDCLTKSQRSVIAEDGAGDGRKLNDRVMALAQAARGAADMCNDTLSPDQLHYDAVAAAADLEQLRSRWSVDRIGIWSVGSGSSVALAYAAAHPKQLGRLILDSPVGYNVAAPQAASARAEGLQNSLAAFAARCSAVGCALGGGDPTAAVQRVISAAGRGSLPGLSDTAVLSAVTTALALGDGSPDALRKLGDALVDADRGQTAALRELATQAQPLRISDGQLVSQCNDIVGKPGLDSLPSLASDWEQDAPMTAVTQALDLGRCDGWGTAESGAAPTSFLVDPLILINTNDPVNGAKAVETLSPLLVAAGADPAAVGWDGIGLSVMRSSDCAAQVADEYLGDRPLAGQKQRACPS